MSFITLTQQALKPYHDGNKNTGNVYEIVFILWLLRRMGLTDADVDALVPYFAVVRTHNPKFAEAWLTVLKGLPVGTGLVFEGSRVVDLRNVTQDDGDGGTGDVVVVLANGQERSISVEEGTAKRDGSISKCLSNPSCKRFGCSDAMIADFKAAAAVAVDEYKAEMTAAYGASTDLWPARVKTKAQNKCIAHIAASTCAHFNGLAAAAQTSIMEDLMQVSGGSKPADYLGLVSVDLKKVSVWSFGALQVRPSDYVLAVKGDFLNVVHRMTGDVIGQTQVKFNNGVYKKDKKDGKWKTSSATSSWNGNFALSKVFAMGRVF